MTLFWICVVGWLVVKALQPKPPPSSLAERTVDRFLSIVINLVMAAILIAVAFLALKALFSLH